MCTLTHRLCSFNVDESNDRGCEVPNLDVREIHTTLLRVVIPELPHRLVTPQLELRVLGRDLLLESKTYISPVRQSVKPSLSYHNILHDHGITTICFPPLSIFAVQLLENLVEHALQRLSCLV